MADGAKYITAAIIAMFPLALRLMWYFQMKYNVKKWFGSKRSFRREKTFLQHRSKALATLGASKDRPPRTGSPWQFDDEDSLTAVRGRGRGRGRGMPTEARATETAAATTVVEVVRRGRPPGSSRGASRGEATIIRRGRGRPPGRR